MLAGHLQTKKRQILCRIELQASQWGSFPQMAIYGPSRKERKQTSGREAFWMIFAISNNEFGELIDEAEDIQVSDTEVSSSKPQTSKKRVSKASVSSYSSLSGDMLFADYMLSWLSYKETEVDPVTFGDTVNL